MNKQILIIGFGSESTIRHFTKYLDGVAARYGLLDLDQIAEADDLSVTYHQNELTVSYGEQHFDFSDYDGFYCRYYYISTSVVEKDEVFTKILQCIGSWLLHTTKTVVNRPGAGSSNASKLSHILDLRDCGFLIPRSYIFGDEKAAKLQLLSGQPWISKGCSSYRTRAKLVADIEPLDFSLLGYVPSQFQEFIAGTDIRLHILGEMEIGLKINSPNTDYRYDTADNKYEIFSVPDHIMEKCRLYCRREQLLFAGFDFKINENGDYYILEANPMPGYEFFDRRLEGKISELLYQLLTSENNAPGQGAALPAGPFIGAERRKKFS